MMIPAYKRLFTQTIFIIASFPCMLRKDGCPCKFLKLDFYIKKERKKKRSYINEV